MSSDDTGPTLMSLNRRNLLQGLSLLLAAAPALSACGDAGFRPLYGPSGAGAPVSEKMKQVDVAPIPGRVGQRIRNEIIFQNTGGGNPLPPTHRLEVVLKESLLSTLVKATGEAEGQIYSVEASFRLIDIRTRDKQNVVFQGASHARAGFERFESIYSNVRAREDAENRVARTLADDLKTRLATYLSRAA
jgi:LPS-assembly lipoprotein